MNTLKSKRKTITEEEEDGEENRGKGVGERNKYMLCSRTHMPQQNKTHGSL